MRWVNALAMALAGVARSAIVSDANDIEFGNPWWFVYAGVSCFLVLFAGIMSGLTLGLMSLGLVELEILQRSGTSTEKQQAGSNNFCLISWFKFMFIEQSVNWFGLEKRKKEEAETDKDVIFETVTIFFILFDTVTKVF